MKKSSSRRLGVAFLVLSVLTFCLSLASVGLITHLYMQLADLEEQRKLLDLDAKSRGAAEQCVPREIPEQDLPNENSIFDPLSTEELDSVQKYLFGQKNLNLKPILEAKPDENYIHQIELWMPNKTQALAHLDKGASRPERQALAILILGAERRVQELLVGPLPGLSYHREYKNPAYQRSEIPIYSIPALIPEEIVRGQIMEKACGDMKKALMESFEMECCPASKTKDCILFGFKAPYGDKSGERLVWYSGFRGVEGETLHPLPLQIMIDCDDTNYKNWKMGGVYYNTTLYNSVTEFMQAYDSGSIGIRVEKQNPTYSSMKPRGSPLPPDGKPGPKVVEPEGRRFTVNGHSISYMNWQLNYAIRIGDGLQLYNIRYSDERILYELGLKEAIAQYGGVSPGAQHTKYYDASWRMGTMVRPLMRGVDCPETAMMLDAELLFSGETTTLFPRSVCVFEFFSSRPQRRHFSDTSFVQAEDLYTGGPDYYLVVRTVMTVWNYDYVVDYMFHVDGVVEVNIGLTGYIQTEYWAAGGESYGFQIKPGVLGSIHNHVLSFKADFDVGGTSNSFVTYDVEAEKHKSIYRADGKEVYQRKFTRNVRDTEQKAALKYDFDKPKYYVVESQDTSTSTGIPRGYRINLRDMSKVTVPLSETSAMSAARWSDYQIASTRHKDYEYSSTTLYAQNEPFDPVLDWSSFIEDDENIDGEDLVTWLSIGLMHIPHTEDLPVTTTSAATIGFKLLPYNYFESDPSMGLREIGRVVPSDRGTSEVTGFKEQSCRYESILDIAYPNIWN